MGGNLFKLGRLPREQYLEIEAEVRAFLDESVGGLYRIPRYYAQKPDFGDLDVVLSSEAFGGHWERFKEHIIDGLGIERYKSTGHVFSTVFRDFQVDYFVRDHRYFLAAYNFLSFNDIGNLVGKMFRRFNLKYGERGLAYVFRRPSQERYVRDIELSLEPQWIFGFLELDFPAWERGFDDLDEMFAWTVASPYFSVAPYFEPSRATEKRLRERTTLQRFVAYLRDNGIGKRYRYLEDRDEYLPRIAAAFPESCLLEEIEREKQREAETLALAQKWNGRLAAEWTGRSGKELGILMRRVREAYSAADLLELSPEAIREAVLVLHAEE